MKSYSHLYEKLISKENILLAIENAAKGKKRRESVRRVLANKEAHAERIIALIESGGVKPQKHRVMVRFDSLRGKKRNIIPPYYYRNREGEECYEQVIQHAIVQVLAPIIMRSAYAHSYGSIPGRGCHSGKRAMEGYIRKHEVRYVLKADIRHFYGSVQPSFLKAQARKKIKDAHFLRVLDAVIDSNVVIEADGSERSVGLPIGFYSSQWLANWFLEPLDRFIKQECLAPFYMRYMDDIVVLGTNKRELHRMREKIAGCLAGMGLALKDNWQVFKLEYEGSGRAIDFMGFKFWRKRTTLRKGILRRARRAWRKLMELRRLYKAVKGYFHARAMSYKGWIEAADVWGWRKRNIFSQ